MDGPYIWKYIGRKIESTRYSEIKKSERDMER